MDGHKFVCTKCGAVFFLIRKEQCVDCGGDMVAYRFKITKTIIRKCSVCLRKFNSINNKSITCDDPKCKRIHEKRNALRYRLRKEKEKSKLIKSEELLSIRLANKKKKAVDAQELLGPEKPIEPLRKCHDCKKMTYGYRCDKCKAKYRAKNRADGLSGTDDLFSGGHIDCAVAF